MVWTRLRRVSRPSAEGKRPDRDAGTAIVFLGRFNPAILAPQWLMRHELLPDDLEPLELDVVAKEVSAFRYEWLRVLAQADKLELVANEEVGSIRLLLDLALGIFKLLPHTPITAFGVNSFVHFEIESDDEWHNIGFKLFDKTPWEGVLADPRMRTVQIESMRPDQTDPKQGATTVTVQPSNAFPQSVFVSVNDHFALGDEPQDPRDGLELLQECFDGSLERSQTVIEHVRGL